MLAGCVRDRLNGDIPFAILTLPDASPISRFRFIRRIPFGMSKPTKARTITVILDQPYGDYIFAQKMFLATGGMQKLNSPQIGQPILKVGFGPSTQCRWDFDNNLFDPFNGKMTFKRNCLFWLEIQKRAFAKIIFEFCVGFCFFWTIWGKTLTMNLQTQFPKTRKDCVRFLAKGFGQKFPKF